MSAADTSFEELWARAERITALEATATLRDVQRANRRSAPSLHLAMLATVIALLLVAGLLLGPRAAASLRAGCATASTQVVGDRC